MKYVVNHPEKFRDYIVKDAEGKEVKQVLKVMVPFMMGFIQTLVAIVVEILVVMHLATKKQFMDVIISYVALAAIVRFDDMYAASLYEHEIRKAVGMRVKKTFFRRMI